MEHALSDDYEIILEHGRERYRAICTCGRLGRAKSDRADAATGIKIHAAAASRPASGAGMCCAGESMERSSMVREFFVALLQILGIALVLLWWLPLLFLLHWCNA